MGCSTSRRLALLVLFAGLAPLSCTAQEIEPRAYSPSPVGANFLVFGYAHSSGSVLSDPSLPVDDIHADLDVTAPAYGHTFPLFGHVASATLVTPYVRGDIVGSVGENRREIYRSGFADARFRFAANLLGGPALTPAEFARRIPSTSLGISLTVAIPTGQYDSRKLINLGANRWAFKPEIGLSHPTGRWYLESYAGVWLFTTNNDFFDGARRKQAPIASLQGHASYTFRPRMWAAVDATYYAGGTTTTDGIHKADRQSNSRVGLTFAVPIGIRQSLKLSWSDGATTRIGSDFSSYGIAWQYTWLD